MPGRRTLVAIARRWHLGRLWLSAYHTPRSFLAKCRREGLGNVLLSRIGMERMKSRAERLPRVEARGEAFDIHFLTGRRFWYQTCFCAYSMSRSADVALRPVVYDDGTLDRRCQDAIRAVFPQALVILRPEIEARLDEVLPVSRYPALRARRIVYPHLRKITDIHAGSSDWKLVLDSDMLFFRRPTFLLDWLRAPQRPCHMVDVENAYGYPLDAMSELARAPIPERVNVGVCGLQSDAIDWERLEFWCGSLIEKFGPHYYQEQALTAMLLAGRQTDVAPAEDYIALPRMEQVSQPVGVMHHYVAESKAWYFRLGWEKALTT